MSPQNFPPIKIPSMVPVSNVLGGFRSIRPFQGTKSIKPFVGHRKIRFRPSRVEKGWFATAPAISLINSPRAEWPAPAGWPRWVQGEVHSSAGACTRRTSIPGPSDGGRRPTTCARSLHPPGSGRLSIVIENRFQCSSIDSVSISKI